MSCRKPAKDEFKATELDMIQMFSNTSKVDETN